MSTQQGQVVSRCAESLQLLQLRKQTHKMSFRAAVGMRPHAVSKRRSTVLRVIVQISRGALTAPNYPNRPEEEVELLFG